MPSCFKVSLMLEDSSTVGPDGTYASSMPQSFALAIGMRAFTDHEADTFKEIFRQAQSVMKRSRGRSAFTAITSHGQTVKIIRMEKRDA